MALSAAERKFGFGGNNRIISRKAFNFFSSGFYKLYGVCYNNADGGGRWVCRRFS